ncbi:uncharacterized protein TNCV_347871 [Trichonephila clavipes]|nr:uncharacterized protein TNCV_347871 [Trichonephila clavipes]
MPNEKPAKYEVHLRFVSNIVWGGTRLNTCLRLRICQLKIVVCSGMSKCSILLELVQQKIDFLLCCMKMEKQAVVLEKESWSVARSLVYADKPQTLDHLEDNIRHVIADIQPQMLEKSHRKLDIQIGLHPKSLGRTQEKYGDFLILLVENCLPEETLLAWERSRNHKSTQNTRSLEHVMNFLRKEVQGEEMVQLARNVCVESPQHNFRKNNALVECVIQRADVMGRLLTGNVVTLHSGLTAAESKLGWTAFGKQTFCGKDKFTTTLSMHVGNIPLQNLLELEVLRITDPHRNCYRKRRLI